MFLKECFDAPCAEAASAHLAVSLFWGQFGENDKRKRYAQLAEMVMHELEEVPAELTAILNYLKVSKIQRLVFYSPCRSHLHLLCVAAFSAS